jgi:hypothetical protein
MNGAFRLGLFAAKLTVPIELRATAARSAGWTVPITVVLRPMGLPDATIGL